MPRFLIGHLLCNTSFHNLCSTDHADRGRISESVCVVKGWWLLWWLYVGPDKDKNIERGGWGGEGVGWGIGCLYVLVPTRIEISGRGWDDDEEDRIS